MHRGLNEPARCECLGCLFSAKDVDHPLSAHSDVGIVPGCLLREEDELNGNRGDGRVCGYHRSGNAAFSNIARPKPSGSERATLEIVSDEPVKR
jgi:hypothetical protein